MTTTSTHLQRALASDPSGPRLTYYDDGTGERVELSTITLANWVTKTTNLLAIECGVGPGSTVALHLPRHWATAVWVLAADAVGARISMGDASVADLGGDSPQVAVIGPDRVNDPPDADEVFAVSLAPLAAPFATALPSLVRDFTVDVRMMPDQIAGPVGPAGDLGAAADARAGALGLVTTDRVVAMGALDGLGEAIDQWLAPLAVGATVVWVRNPKAPQFVSRWAAERVTAVAGALTTDVAVPDSIRILG